jgi:hypothetical protein
VTFTLSDIGVTSHPSIRATAVIRVCTVCLSLATVALSLLVIGCMAPRATPLASDWKMVDTGITLSPPGDLVATISGDAAYVRCLTGLAACAPSVPTAIELALATDTGSGQLDANGNLQLTLNKTLVWAIRWLEIPCPPRSGGGPILSTSSPSAPSAPVATAQPLCDEVAFIDAGSGQFYFTETGPHH